MMSSRMMFKTDEAEKRNHMPMPHQEHITNQVRQTRRNRMNNKALTRYHSPLLVPHDELDEMKGHLLYTMIKPHDFGKFADEAAAALAMMALAYGLNPANDEIWALPKKGQGGKIVGFKTVAGYKGLLRAARDVAQFDRHTDFNFGEANRLSPDEVTRRGAHYCFRCNAKGCYKCKKKGQFDPTDVIVIRIPLVVYNKVQAAGEYFTPTWGVGVWQPGDNISEGRDAEWQCTKRAKTDAIRQEFDLPLFYGERPGQGAYELPDDPKITVINPHERDLPDVIEAARLANITYDDAEAFIEAVESAIDTLGFQSPGHVMEAFIDMDHTHLTSEDIAIVDAALQHWLNQEQEAQFDEGAASPQSTVDENIPRKPQALLDFVNQHIEVAYDSLPHLLNALKQQFGQEWSWPAFDDEYSWSVAKTAAIEHAEAKTQPEQAAMELDEAA